MTTIITPSQANVRCLDLYNGSSNNAVPTNWEQTGFDDSGWGFSANPSLIDGVRDTDTFSTSGFADGAEAIWPTSTARSGTQPDAPPGSNGDQYALFRWHFTMPGTYTFASFSRYQTFRGTPGPANEVSYWINGTLADPFSNSGLHAVCVPGDNVMAWWVARVGAWTSAGGGVGAFGFGWATSAWFTFIIRINALATGRSLGQVIG